MNNFWLPRALEESRARGFLGPGAIDPQIDHAQGFAASWESIMPAPPTSFIDLGSGGGLPGLVLLERWKTRGVLIDSMEKRIAFLQEVLTWAGAPSDAEVILGRAELLARREDLEGKFELVTARSFGPPAVTAECAVRFLTLNGVLIVSEPPNDNQNRWNAGELSSLGLELGQRVRHEFSYQLLRKVASTPRRYPREVGIPGKNPLF